MISFNSYLGAVSQGLAKSSAALGKSFERLSSGSRINRASDDAAGLAISSSLLSHSRIYTQATKNANDGISLLNIASGTLSQLSDVTIRLKELAQEASNGTYSRTQRLSLDIEAKELVNEYNRVIGSAFFNGRKLLNGSFGSARIQLGLGLEGSLALTLGENIDRNIGTGTFGTAVSVGGYPNLNGYFLADFNGDGKVDIASTRALGTNVTVRFGAGDGTFGSANNYALGANGAALAGGDIDGDGDIDLVAATAGEVIVFRNNGSGTFSVGQTLALASTQKLALGDVNGDGIMDLLRADSSSLTVYQGTSAGVFSGSGISHTLSGTQIGEIKVGDLNNDGKSDVLLGTTTAGTVNVFIGTATGALSRQADVGSAGRSLSIGDINHDGILDFTAADSGGIVNTYLGDGTGLFSQSTSLNLSSSGTVSARLVDINRDGIVDILASSSLGTLDTFFGKGDGTFFAAISQALNVPGLIDTADLNSDGSQDLFYSQTAGGIFSALSRTELATTIARLDLTTQSGALQSLDLIETILQQIAQELGNIGGLQSRIQTSLGALDGTILNYRAAAGRIVDADTAEESAGLVKNIILQQTSADLISQANILPELALSLLQQAGI